MNSGSFLDSPDGQKSVRVSEEESNQSEQVGTKASDQDMKRAAAKQLIEKYYYQLKEGCGNENCPNENCASSSSFKYGDVTCNQLALQAISLSQNKVPLCERRPPKQLKYLSSGDDNAVGESAEFVPPSTSTSADPCRNNTHNHNSSSSSPVVQKRLASSFPSSSASATATINSIQEKKRPLFLNEESLNRLISECEASQSWSQLIRTIGSVFSDPTAVSLSFNRGSSSSRSDEATSSDNANAAPQTSMSEEDNSLSEGSSVDPVVDVTPSVTEPIILDESLSVDVESLRRTYQRLMSIPDVPFQGALINALITVAKQVELQLKYRGISDLPNLINVFVIILEIPLLHSPEFLESAFPCMCRALQALPLSEQAKLARVWSKFGRDHLTNLLQSLQQLITVKVINHEDKWSSSFTPCADTDITSATSVMKVVFYASLLGGEIDSPDVIEKEKTYTNTLQEHLLDGAFGYESSKESAPPKEDPLGKECNIRVIDCHAPLIPYEDFINESLNNCLDVGVDYTNYRLESDNKFSFVLHNFILTTASKHTSMYFDNRIRMMHERRTAVMQALLQGGPRIPFLRIRVRRDHLVEDALVNLEMFAMENPSELRKQLFVEFDGEQGLDEGGVSKEFFQLIVEELFNPDIGMFTYNEESHHFWFNTSSFENDAQFTLIGIVLGLAIYNSCILDIHFPMVVYRKLLGKLGQFEDLLDVDPTLQNSLKEMLEYEGDDIETIFCQSFRIGYKDVYGNTLTHDLKENGDQIMVTQENKKEFVALYADYLLNQSIERQFGAFKRGFLMVTSESPLKYLFRPEEVEMLVCGSKNFDFYALEEATEYDGGFTKESPTIRNFWQVVHEMTEVEKRKLLQFTTGTDRVPVGGLAKLKMFVAKNGPDSDRLPTAHTCFNVLLLPEYPTVEKMREQLLKAINYSKGFGML